MLAVAIGYKSILYSLYLGRETRLNTQLLCLLYQRPLSVNKPLSSDCIHYHALALPHKLQPGLLKNISDFIAVSAMLSFLSGLAKKRPAPQAAMTRSDSMDSALLSSTNASSFKGDKDSTPATSMADTPSIAFDTTPKITERGEGIRSLRASRSNISTYNENVLSGSAKHGYRKKRVSTGSRVVSGETLVEGQSNSSADFVQRSTQGLDQDWSLGSLPGDNLNLAAPAQGGANKRRSTRLSVLEFASTLMEQTRSVLGKRGREDAALVTEKPPSIKQEVGNDGSAHSAVRPSFEGPASKRLRMDHNHGALGSIVNGSSQSTKRPPKRWLTQGLYVGQDSGFDPRLTTAKNKLKKANRKAVPATTRSVLPLPMFAGQRILESGRNFKLPFDVFSPLPAGQPKPDEWKKTHKSKLLATQSRGALLTVARRRLHWRSRCSLEEVSIGGITVCLRTGKRMRPQLSESAYVL